MKVLINGKPIDEVTIEDIIKNETLITEDVFKECNRETRRSKPMRVVASILAVVSGLALTTVAHAQSADPSVPTTLPEIVKQWALNKISNIPEALSREDSMMWQMNKYMNDVLLKTFDFFTNSTILDLYHTVSAITLSFTTLIIAKKGFDMIKAKMLGTSSLGLPEMIIRLICSLVIMFISLKVGSVGIALSNKITSTFFATIMQGFVPTELVLKGVLGTFFWTITYVLLFAVLGVRYWIRQINMVFIGLMAPVASLSWVVDGGAMLSTLIKEFVTYLTTPIAQGAVIVIGTVMLTEVAANFTGFGGVLSQLLIGVSTLFVAIFTPDILKKFIQGNANPLAFAMKTAMQLKSFPLAMKGLLLK